MHLRYYCQEKSTRVRGYNMSRAEKSRVARPSDPLPGLGQHTNVVQGIVLYRFRSQCSDQDTLILCWLVSASQSSCLTPSIRGGYPPEMGCPALVPRLPHVMPCRVCGWRAAFLVCWGMFAGPADRRQTAAGFGWWLNKYHGKEFLYLSDLPGFACKAP